MAGSAAGEHSGRVHSTRHHQKSLRAAGLALTIAVATVGLSGCGGLFRDNADHDVYALLNQRERQVLGAAVESKIGRGEVPTDIPAAAYSKVPATKTQLPPGYALQAESETQPATESATESSTALTAPAPSQPATSPAPILAPQTSSLPGVLAPSGTLPTASPGTAPAAVVPVAPQLAGIAAAPQATGSGGLQSITPVAKQAAGSATGSGAAPATGPAADRLQHPLTPQDVSSPAAATASANPAAATAPAPQTGQNPTTESAALSDSVDALVKAMPGIDLEHLPPLPKFPAPLKPGQKRLVFSLEDCFDYALNHSRDYQTQKEDLYIDALKVLLARHQFEPQPFARTSVAVERTPEATDFQTALSATQTVGVRQNLPFGGQIVAQGLVDLVDQMRHNVGTPSAGSSFSLTGNIPLLRGAGMVAQESLIQSERNLVYSVRDFEQFRRNFLVQVASAYFNLVDQRAQVRNGYRSVESYSFITARTQALFDAGRPLTTLLDVQRALQSEYGARNDLINSVEQYELAVDNFKLLIGMPVEQVLDIAPQYLNVAPPNAPEDAAVKVGLKLRLDLQTVEDRVADARRAVGVAGNNLLPDLTLNAGATVGSDPAQNRYNPDPHQTDISAGLTFDWPLDRVAERNSYRTALINLERAKRNAELTEDQVAIDVRSSLRQVRQQVFLLALQKNNIDLAQKRKEFADIQYRAGQVDNRDYLDAETSLLDAENRFASALASLQVAILQYLRDTGQMKVSAHGKLILPASLVVAQPAH